MSCTANEATEALRLHATDERAEASSRFFKTGPGEYGEGDRFLGVNVPDTRRVCRAFRDMPLGEVTKLLSSPWHEERLLALFILVWQFQRAEPKAQRKIYRFYLRHLRFINNWDLVDSSAEHVIGAYLFERDKEQLYRWAKSRDLWKRRIAVMATFHFIKRGNYQPTLALAEILLNDPHDLMHKAVGWMLREIGNRDRTVEEDFLRKHYPQMPRTMLRYAIEKFPEKKRQAYLKGRVPH